MAVARSIASAVTSTIKSALSIASPSKVTRRLGAYTAEGFALGIGDMLPDVGGEAAALAETVTGRLSGTAYSAAAMSSAPVATAVRVGNAHDGDGMSGITSRLDRLIDYLTTTEQSVRVDGRDFGRVVREYI